MIVTLWQCPDPQFKISKLLQELILETGLESRSIDPKELITEGHPFFVPGAREKTDSLFPRIGVEWESDEPTEDLGMNQSNLLITGPLKERILKAFQTSKYEHLDFDRFNEFLQAKVKYADTHSRHVDSSILLTGWAVGNAAEKTHLFLYQALDACIPYLFKQMVKEFGVNISVPENGITLNIVNHQFGDIAFGFEYKIRIRQLREHYRLLVDEKIPLYTDIFYNAGRSSFDLKP